MGAGSRARDKQTSKYIEMVRARVKIVVLVTFKFNHVLQLLLPELREDGIQFSVSAVSSEDAELSASEFLIAEFKSPATAKTCLHGSRAALARDS